MTIKLDIISLAVDADMVPSIKKFNKDKIIIGRGKNIDLNLEHDDVSSKHATIYVNEDNSLSIEDLGSLNGTTVGDTKIAPQTPCVLKKKDRIMIGDYLIKASYIETKAEEATPTTNDDIKENILHLEENNDLQSQSQEQIEVQVQNEFITEDIEETNEPKETEDTTNVSNEMIEDFEMQNILSNNNLLTDEIPTIDDNIFELEEDLIDESNSQINNNPQNINTTKEKNILASQENLINEDRREFEIATNNTENKTFDISTNDSKDNNSFLVISGTANDNIFDINLEAIKLFTLEGQCKRFGIAIQDVLITLNDEKAISDKNGYFKFTNIEENSLVNISAEKAGYVFKNKSNLTSITKDSSVTFEGVKTCYISGKILYKGKGLEGVAIINNIGKDILTSSDGSFCIKDIEEGSNYIIKPQKENFIFDFDDSEKTLNEDTTFVINATKLISISGYIKYKGTPIADVIIDAGELGKTITDKNGFYEFKNIKEGTQYSLKAYKEGFKFQKA